MQVRPQSSLDRRVHKFLIPRPLFRCPQAGTFSISQQNPSWKVKFLPPLCEWGGAIQVVAERDPWLGQAGSLWAGA